MRMISWPWYRAHYCAYRARAGFRGMAAGTLRCIRGGGGSLCQGRRPGDRIAARWAGALRREVDGDFPWARSSRAVCCR